MRELIIVYAIEKDGRRFKVAGYDRETALKVIDDSTVQHIVGCEKLIAVRRNGEIIGESKENVNA